MTQKVIDKIMKCLALSKSSNPNEAATALRHAQKLMATHNLTMSEVEISRVTEHRITVGKRTTYWRNLLSATVADALNCRHLISKNRNGIKIYEFIGIGEAPEICAYTYEVLARQLLADEKAFKASDEVKQMHPSHRRNAFRAFREYWAVAVRRLIENTFNNECDELKAADQYISNQFGKPKKLPSSPKKISSTATLNAARKGLEAGQTAKLFKAAGADKRPQLERL